MKLTKYKCHKTVQAGKIASFDLDAQGDNILVLVGVIEPVTVSEEYMHNFMPKKDGYYILHEDGYESFSPEEPFLKHYTKIEE